MPVVFYRASDGSEPVNDFIDTLPPAHQAALDLCIDRLNMLTSSMPHLPFPHSSQVEGELRELRCHYGRTLFRVLYRQSGKLYVLLHIFQKTTRTVPEADIATARQRWNDFQERMNAPQRTRPRAAGHDAPSRR